MDDVTTSKFACLSLQAMWKVLRRTTKRNYLPVLTFRREARTKRLISSGSDNCLEFILYGYLPAKNTLPFERARNRWHPNLPKSILAKNQEPAH